MQETIKKVENKVIKYPIIEVKENGKLIISENVQKRIDMLHAQIGSKEWCAFITYDKEAGNINEPSTYVARVKDIYPMGIGSETYTETENTASELIKMDERIPSYFMSRSGYCHTHHNMKAYFSQTDMQELHNNVDKYDGDSYYLSLIVNFEKQYVGKIAKLITIPATQSTFKEAGETFTIDFPEEKYMRLFDLDVVIEGEVVWDDDMMQTRINELKAEVEEKKKVAAAKAVVSTSGSWVKGKDDPKGKWVKNKQGMLVFTEETLDYRMYLKMILECSDTPTLEIGQSLIHLVGLKPDAFDDALEEMYGYIHGTAFEVFGYGNIIQGLTATNNILKGYLNAPKWAAEVGHVMEVINNVINDMEQYMSEDTLELEEFTL
jgi:hypothetical protein